MLFQPTFLSPSLQWGVGNGTVDVNDGIEFSWQVNGSSEMTSFEIVIYENNAASTQVYTTTEITYNCPFSGVNYAGESVMFSYYIDSTTLTTAGMSNGNEYKFIITQWWDTTESITQTSATAFRTRETPTLAITPFATPVASRSQTFTATYSQNEGDSLNWVRWQIAYTSDTANPFFDTEKIYGTSQLQCDYDGLFDGQEYAVRCIVQTENGIEVSTGWEVFDVSYSTNTLEGVVDATCVCKHSAVKVSWDEVTYMPGVAVNSYSILNGELNLPTGSSVSWSSVNGRSLNLKAPWTLFYKMRVQNNSGLNTMLDIVTSGDSIQFKQYNATALRLVIGGTTVATSPALGVGAEVTVCLTNNAVHFYVARYGGGLYPDSTLTPDATLYPQDDILQSEATKTTALTYTQSGITSITLNGAQVCDYVQVESGYADDITVNEVLSGNYMPIQSSNTLFFVSFDYGLNAGNLNASGDTLVGYAVYRRQGSSGTLQHIIDVQNVSDTAIYDFGVGSQQGAYTYYIFPIGETTYIAEPLLSNEIYPIYWEWTILQCTQRTDGTYQVDREFQFANNVSSGTISNNNAPNVVNNFTRYPTVQLAPQNYMSGTLSALIGAVDFTDNSYSDTIQLRNAIFDLSTTTDTLFLKNRKGDVIEIKISAPIQMATSDTTVEQIQTTSIPWVQVNEAKNTPIVALLEDPIVS